MTNCQSSSSSSRHGLRPPPHLQASLLILPLLLLRSVSVSVSVSLAGVNEAAFCLSAISFLLFSFHLFVLPGEKKREREGSREGRLKNAHSLTNYLESIYLSRASQTSNCYDTFQSPLVKQTRQFNSQKQAKLSTFYG